MRPSSSVSVTKTDAASRQKPVRVQVRRVLWVTLLLNLAVACGKIVLGAVTGALAISADGFHSLTDSAGNVAGLVANVYASTPPDAEHPYGHRRFETLAALLIGGLLLLTAWEMVQSVLHRLQAQTLPSITPLTFVVLVATLCINIGVNVYQTRAGRRLQSEILLADAKNTRTDIFVTLSVIFSTAAFALTGWWWLDVIAALIVVLLIAHAAWQIVRDTGRVLVDTAPYPSAQLLALLHDIPLVHEVRRARSRGNPDAAHIDVDVAVEPALTAEQAAAITHAIRQRLTQALSGIAEIEVHVEPDQGSERDVAQIARATANAHGMDAHEVQLSQQHDGALLELHVEVPPDLTLRQAHATVSRFEHDMQQALPDVQRVVTHIEPIQQPVASYETQQAANQCRRLLTQVKHLLQQHYPLVGWHDLQAQALPQGFGVTLHAVLAPHMTVEAAHNVAENAETLLRGQIPQLARVTIHTEPFDHEE